MKTYWATLLTVGLALGCKGDGGSPSTLAKDSTTDGGPMVMDANDPCRLVSQAEMERFIGPLLEAPYRTDSRRPSPEGEGCLYRAKDYRSATLEVDREGGALAFRMLAGTGGKVEEALAGADMSTDTLEANWDKVGRAFGQLIALKGASSVQIDPIGSRLDLPAQVEIVRIALGRLDKPLAYDGARAARTRKDVGVAPRDPCSLVTRAEVEAAMGRLRAAPHASEDGRECVFPVDAVFLGTPVERSLQVQWADGFYALGQERQAMGLASKSMAGVMGADLPSLGENAAREKEPWDERITLLGGVITVIKRDVLLKLAADGMGGFDEAKALALLRAAAARI
jgi:hypothetical protein